MAVEELWEEYMTSRDDDARQKLIVHYLPLVKYLAGRLAMKLPGYISREDLEGYGVFGLMGAVQKYDPGKGASFETYAGRRIYGAMIDELRRHGYIPRNLWQKLVKVKKVREELEKKFGGPVSQQALARETGMSVEELGRLYSRRGLLNPVSLDEEPGGAEGEAVLWGSLLEDRSSPDPLTLLLEKEERAELVRAIEKLEDRDKVVLALYYQDGLTLKEIGQVLGVSESRVCQLHARAITRLRKKLQQQLQE